MSNAIQTRALLEGIRTALLVAWPDLTSIDFEKPRAGQRVLPYAVVNWEAVDIGFDQPGASARMTGQTNTFTIVRRDKFPADGTILSLAKIDYANAAIAQLQPGPNFATIGFIPVVTRVDPGETDEDEGAFEVTLTFVVQTVADHH